MKILILFLLLNVANAADFNLSETFKNKKIKLEGDNFGLMNLFSSKLSQLKIAHFSEESVVTSMKSLVASQQGLATPTDIKAGKMVVGHFTVKIQGKKPVIMKIINNETAEVQTNHFFDENEFQNAFLDGKKNKMTIQCSGLNNCFEKRPICRIQIVKDFENKIHHEETRFLIMYGDKIIERVSTLNDAFKWRDYYAEKKLCDLEEMNPTEPCSIVLNPKYEKKPSQLKFVIQVGKTSIWGNDSLDVVIKNENGLDALIKAKLCYDLHGSGYSNNFDSTKNLIQLTGNIPEYLAAPKDNNGPKENIYDEFQRFTKPKDPSRNISGEKPEKTKGV